MNKKEQGKKNRSAGARFELKVRKDLESKGWVVAKWTNNIDLYEDKMVPALSKYVFNPFTKKRQLISNNSGFPDFIAIKHRIVYAFECKINGYLTPLERKKMAWYKSNNTFFDLQVASLRQGEIIYTKI